MCAVIALHRVQVQLAAVPAFAALHAFMYTTYVVWCSTCCNNTAAKRVTLVLLLLQGLLIWLARCTAARS
jgi:hypothetical protein